MIKHKPDILYAYGDKAVYLSSFWKFLFRYKLIADYRGDGVDERRKNGWHEIKLTLLSKLDMWCRNRANKIFIVSEAYKNFQKNGKYVVKYNYYDGYHFQFYEGKSILKKNELGLSDKFIFVYSGGIHYYQMIEEMIFFFANFNKRHKDSFFIIISEYDQNTFISCFKKYNVSSNFYSIHKLNHENVNELLIVGDMANYKTQQKEFLFANHLLNRQILPNILQGDFVNGGSTFIRGDVVEKVGLFEEKYFMYNDEIDLAFRVKKSGYKTVVTSEPCIWHYHDWSKKNKSSYYFMYYYMMRNRILFYKTYKLYFNLISDLFSQLLTLPIKIKWLSKLANFRLVKYYYLGLWRGLIGETEKSKINFK